MLNFLKKNKNINFFPPLFKDGEKKIKTKIFVAVSGGVDSSVALALLQKKGYNVEGVFFRKFNPDKEKCQREKSDAEKVCKQLNVPFHFLDLEQEYKDKILKYFIESYRKGETPNPDILCNKFIKFGAFLKYAEEKGADFIATGHYARNISLGNTKKKMFYFFTSAPYTNNTLGKKTKQLFFLTKAKDKDKDQTYFLAMLSQKQLSKSIFPLGDLKKPQVRRLAKKFNLLTADKKDSQGVCFLGEKVKLNDFLEKYIEKEEGNLLDEKGVVIGKHRGVSFYTIGQRYGFEIDPKFKSTNQKKLFVIKKDAKNNTVTVSEKHLEQKRIIIKNINLISNEISFQEVYQGRIRYRGELINVKVKLLPQGRLELNFDRAHRAVSSGQFVVFYDGDVCVGGGEII